MDILGEYFNGLLLFQAHRGTIPGKALKSIIRYLPEKTLLRLLTAAQQATIPEPKNG